MVVLVRQGKARSGKAKAAPDQAGDVWTWTAIDAESKLILSYMVGDRDRDPGHGRGPHQHA
ncbi:hypothetical protein BV133_951 [Blastochloris viridis]|uniref:Transposase n=1 Tax=Blastochloris viridis TaxID=1079 RepID=A0A182CZI8_BLAVI|nr:hypothetical protein BV133_951 [Blastochloris viridis]